VKSQAMPLLKNEPFACKRCNGRAKKWRRPPWPFRFSPSAVLAERYVFYFRHAATAPRGGVCRPRCFLETSGGWPPRLPRHNSFCFRDMYRLLPPRDRCCPGETPVSRPISPPPWGSRGRNLRKRRPSAPPRRRASVATAHGASDAPAFPLGRECDGGGRVPPAARPRGRRMRLPRPPRRKTRPCRVRPPSDKFSKAAADGGPMNLQKRAPPIRRERGSPAPSTSIG